MTVAKRIRLGLLTIAALVALATSAQAAVTEWQFDTWGYWDDATKWTNGVPDQDKDAVLDKNYVTYLRNGSTSNAASLVVGKSTAPFSPHTLSAEANASLTITNDMKLGVLTGARGDFGMIEGCSLTVGGNLIVGDAGESTSYTRGALQVTGGLYMGNSSTSSNNFLTISGNSTFGHAHIGVYGSGGLTQGGGECIILGDLTAGVHNDSNGGFSMDAGEFQVNNVVLGLEAGSVGHFAISAGGGGTARIIGNLTVGNYGTGEFSPRGGQLTAGDITLAQEAGSIGLGFITNDASLTVVNLVVGQAGEGASFEHSYTGDPGSPVVNVSDKLTLGATKPPGWDPMQEEAQYNYVIRKGTLSAAKLEVGAGRFVINNAAVVINVTQSLTFSADASFQAAAGSAITLTGADFFNNSTHPGYIWGLNELELVFTGGAASWKTMEIGGKDYGENSQGFTDNFHLANLTVTGTNTRVSLLDAVDNGQRGPGNAPEALYVNTLHVNEGATLNLNNLALYTYLDTEIHRVQAGEGWRFGNGQIINSSPGSLPGIILPLLLD